MFANVLLLCLIALGRETIEVEIADSPISRSIGLMGRETLPQDSGMLFIFERPQIASFWMKNVKVPLSIAFFDQEKKLIEIMDMAVVLEGRPRTYLSSQPALYALEVPQNWFWEKRIRPGMKFSFLEDHR